MTDYQEYGAQRWPPPDTDTGSRAPWLSEPLTGKGLRDTTAYIRGVLLGDDRVVPDVKMAERGLSLLAGLMAAQHPRLDEVLDEIDEAYG